MAADTALVSHDVLWQLWRTLTYQTPHNTAVVLRGTSMLGLACGVVGTFLLLRKRSLVADAMSHAALPGVCAGFLLATWWSSASNVAVDARSLTVLLPSAAVFAMLGVACVHVLSRTPRVKEDAAIGVVLSVFFAVGIVLLGVIQRLPAGNQAGLNTFIFGQAATMSRTDAAWIGATAAIVVAIALLIYKELRLLCFDAAFARSLGWSATLLDGALLALVTALTVIGLHAVGAILMVALLIIPAAAARFWTQRLSVMLLLAAAVGALACHVGTAVSAIAIPRSDGSGFINVPTGPAIVVACGTLFIVSMLAAPRRGLIFAMAQRAAMARIVARQHLLRAMYEQEEILGRPGAPVSEADLLIRRAWTPRRLRRILNRELRKNEIVGKEGGFALTESGRRAAAKIVRTHRIWEHFLTTQADIAPSHVDRAADDIEHVLSDELIRDLEADLRAQGALPEGEFVPRSAHRLAPAGGASNLGAAP